MGAAHVLVLHDGNQEAEFFTLVRPNSVNMLWQFPQLFVLSVGEILFSISGLEFSYTQAAPNMKSVLPVSLSKVPLRNAS